MNFFNFIAGLGNRVLREEFLREECCGLPHPRHSERNAAAVTTSSSPVRKRGESGGETERRRTRFSIGRETWVIQGVQVRMYYEHRVKLKIRGMRDGNLIPSRKCRGASTAISLPIVARARRIFQYAGFSTKEQTKEGRAGQGEEGFVIFDGATYINLPRNVERHFIGET